MALAFFALASAGAFAAPTFVTDGRYKELQALVLAQDAGGSVTALDVLLYLDIARDDTASIVPIDEWLAKPEERKPASWNQIKAAVEQFLAIQSFARAGPPPQTPDYVQRDLLYSAAEATWVDSTVRPDVRVDDADINRYYIAHPEKYAEPERAQVRYIFFPVADLTQLSRQREAETKLQTVRTQIAKGEIKFEDAAKQFSGAPSKNSGGLIPEFTRGTHFQELEYQSFALKKPGDMSPVFAGNEGVYLVQLVSRIEPKRAPLSQVKEEIRERLAHEHIRSYYKLALEKLKAKSYTANYASLWQYTALETPVSLIGGTTLTRDQLMKINPAAINANYDVQWGVVLGESERWIEGEIVLRDVERQGLGGGPYIARAKQISQAYLTARAAIDGKVPLQEVATKEAALKTLGGEGSAQGITQSRVIAISLLPDDEALKAEGRQEAVHETIRQLTETVSRGELPTRPTSTEFAKALAEAAAKNDDELQKLLDSMRRDLKLSPWTDVTVRLQDLGWKDSLPGLSPFPAIVGLKAGQLSGAQPIASSMNYYYVAAQRVSEKNPWMDSPLALRTAAFDTQKKKIMDQEIAKIQSMGLLQFKVGK